MKFVLAIALLCICAVAAQTQAPNSNVNREFVEALEKRGEALLGRVKVELEKLRHDGHWHLAGAIDHQAVLIEALVLDLKTKLANNNHQVSLYHLHVIEEELLHMENFIFDELRIIDNVRNHHQHQGHNHSDLVTKGENLIKQAHEALAHHSHLPEAKAIQREVQAIEALLKDLKSRPSATDLKKDEQQLARHEQSLQILLEKAANRGDH